MVETRVEQSGASSKLAVGGRAVAGLIMALVFLGLAFLGLAATGCSDETASPPGPATLPAAGGAGPEPGAGGNGGAAAASVGPGGGGLQVTPVRLGVRANPASMSASSGAPGDDAEMQASLLALAAGVRSAVVEVPLDEVDAMDLEAEVAALGLRDVRAVVQLTVVDRLRSRNPVPAADWDDPVVVAAFDAARDEVIAAGVGGGDDDADSGVRAAVLGRDVGVYLEAHPDETMALTALLRGGITRLRDAGIPAGIGLAYREPRSPEFDALAAEGDVLALSYFPALVRPPDAPTTSTPGQDLDAIVALAAMRPVLLTDVGVSSAPEAEGSNETIQRQRLAGFLAALEPRRPSFPTVVIHELHDRDGPTCDALAASRGEASDERWAAITCATGLRGADGMPKEAWGWFTVAAAQLSSP
ncbi:MAG: hypothetical protein AAF928_15245 [Myxococcota bacterium]